MGDLEIRLMGAVEAVRDGRPVAVPGRRVRTLLAMLALSAGETVSTDALALGIWGDEPPEKVRASLQTYVSRLRTALGPELVTTDPGGYTLRVPREAVDLLRLGHRIAGETDDRAEDERAVLTGALAQWREPLFGHDSTPWLERHETPGWVEQQLIARERLIDLDMAAGHHTRCIAELTRLTENHPLRESLWERLLLCLDRSGRTAEALEAFEELRTRLAEELGVDPAPALRAIHRDLLDKPDHPDTWRRPTPRQLPIDVHGFTGRTEQLDALDAVLTSLENGDAPGVVALHGPAGAGKTTLAVHWAHRVRRAFPDGQLFINLRGYGTGDPVSTAVASDALLRGLGVHGDLIPVDEQARLSLLRSELADRALLIVLDNARDSEHVRPLVPGGRCLVLTTSRAQVRSLSIREGALRVPVPPMSPAESADFLRHRLGRDPGEDAAEVSELADLCGHLPIALAVAAERAGRDGSRPLRELTAQLRDQHERLDALSAWQDDPLTDVRAVFQWSHQRLDEPTARLFRLLGLHVDRQISTKAAAALGGLDEGTARRLLDRLVDGHLLSGTRPGWYELHDLIRIYAAELVEATDAEHERRTARERLRSWFVHSAHQARQVLSPPLFATELADPAEGITPERFEDPNQAFAWFSDYHRALKAVVAEAAGVGDHRTAYTLAPLLSAYLTMIAASPEAIDLYQRSEACAEEAGGTTARAVSACYLGTYFVRIGEYDDGQECLERAAALFERADDAVGLLNARNNLGLIPISRGRVDEAIEVYENLLTDARSIGAHDQVALILNNMAECYRLAGRPNDAVNAAREAVAGYRRSDDPYRLAGALDTLGETQAGAELFADAVDTFGEALDVYASIGQSSNEAVTLKRLGLAHRGLGNTQEAVDTWRRALTLLDEIGASDVTEVSRDELGELIANLTGA
ncbi:BTAD domain-containing putative transcriptional regulator [Aeromicrobium sp. CTD01-1L150]|uniref:AfsR/SARP family transcriptional regulator n=1 Tax=Aeromicrobium sp. CTD01-1L150 TaxID=3341830 RepID=UPI0035BF4C28